MEYRGYSIEYEFGHYKVTSPDGKVWREDTEDNAKKEVDRILAK